MPWRRHSALHLRRPRGYAGRTPPDQHICASAGESTRRTRPYRRHAPNLQARDRQGCLVLLSPPLLSLSKANIELLTSGYNAPLRPTITTPRIVILLFTL